MLVEALDVGEKIKRRMKDLELEKEELEKQVDDLGRKLAALAERQVYGYKDCLINDDNDEDITSETPDVFICKVCFTRKAKFSCIPCGHTFCKTDLMTIYEANKKCPVCRVQFCKILMCRFP